MAHVIDYPSPETRLRPRRWLLRPATIVAAALLAVGLYQARDVAVWEHKTRIDAVTGSMSRQRTWLFGITSGPTIDVSPLERRLAKMGVTWTPKWQGLSTTSGECFGLSESRGCASAPPVYHFRPV